MDFLNKENLSNETILDNIIVNNDENLSNKSRIVTNDETNELLDLLTKKTNLFKEGNFNKNEIKVLFKYILNGDIESLKILIRIIQVTNS